MRPIAIVGAPSSIGIKPYADGRPRALDRAPRVLRELGLVDRLGAHDLGDTVPPPYRDVVRPPAGVRNEADLVEFLGRLAERVDQAIRTGSFVVVLGGDCSIVLASLMGIRVTRRRVALAYLDAHADFATPQESRTGSAASMCLGMAVGRGDTPLARMLPDGPLVRGSDVAIIGRRDNPEQIYGEHALAEHDVLNINAARLLERGPAAAAKEALSRVDRDGLDGFWIHLDADVLDASVMHAVDTPETDGPGFAEMGELVARLAAQPRALGIELTIFDPELDPGGACGRGLADLLEGALT